MTVLLICLSISLILAAGAVPVPVDVNPENQFEDVPCFCEDVQTEAASVPEEESEQSKKPMDELHRF